MTPHNSNPDIVVVGAGYVGLVTSACLTQFGYKVGLVEVDLQKRLTILSGKCPFFEPELQELIRSATNTSQLKLFDRIDSAIQTINPDAVFIAVGTPQTREGECDLGAVTEAMTQIARAVQKETVVVLKSTVPVGTAFKFEREIHSESNFPIHIVNNPEFLREGTAVRDFMNPARIVVGSSNSAALSLMRRIYAPLILNGCYFLEMDHMTAELSKYAANLMLASRITVMNQVSRICDRVGANIDDIERVIGSDSRIGSKYLAAGLGYGGSCFHKDLRAMSSFCRRLRVSDEIISGVDRFNESQKLYFLKDIKNLVHNGGTIAVLGLSFKPDTDDVREAVSVSLIPRLIEMGFTVRCHDPVAIENFACEMAEKGIDRGIQYVTSIDSTIEGADAIVAITEWPEYVRLLPAHVKNLMRGRVVFDGRNMWSQTQWVENGFEYHGVGKPSSPHVSESHQIGAIT